MQIQTLLKKTKRYLLNYLQAQLLVTLVSLPILISWGLPISKLGIVGNLIFAPILSAFLVISSLVFFTELLLIPNNFLIKILNQITIWWEKILNLGQKNWLIGFSEPINIILIMIPMLTFLIIYNKKINTLHKRVIALSLLSFLTFSVLYLPNLILCPKREELFLNNKVLKIIQTSSGLVLNDYGYISQKRNLPSFLDYELKPYLIKNYGTIKIDKLLLHKKMKINVYKKIINEFDKVFEVCPGDTTYQLKH